MNCRKGIRMLMISLFLAVFCVTLPAKTAMAANGKHVIVIDPGHGADTSAEYWFSGVYYSEEQICWKIAKYLEQELAKYPNIETYLTKDSVNVNPGLEERVIVAQQHDADFLISIHLNAIDSSSADGACVLISNGNYRPELANNERIFTDFVSAELQNLGIRWRGPLLRDSQDGSLYPNNKIRDYYGIVAHSVEKGLPGVIVEHCFISNPTEAKKYLSTEAGIRSLAVADANAIVKYCQVVPAGFNDRFKTNVDTENLTGWKYSDGNYYYYVAGELQKSKFLTLSDGTYYVDANGKRVSGWLTLSGKTYYFNSNGVMQKGWQNIGGKRYYFSTGNGVMFQNTLHVNSNGTTYNFESDGALTMNQFKTIDGKTYYFGSNGAAYKGVKAVNGKYYCFNASTGVLLKNQFVTISGKTYYAGSDGAVLTGWQNINGKRYYFGSGSGVMLQDVLHVNSNGTIYNFEKDGALTVNQFLTIGGKTYYFGSNGAALKGAKKVGDIVYCFDPTSGALLKNQFVTINGNTYYASADGKALKGWQTINGKKYYFSSGNGIMFQDMLYVNGSGTIYNFEKDGVLTMNQFKTIDGKTYYFGSNGAALKGAKKVNDIVYCFDGTSGVLLKNQFMTYGGNTYYAGSDGKALKGWQTIDGKRYYFSSGNGVMFQDTLHVNSNGTIYYFGKDGALAMSEFKTIDGNTYYFGAKGAALKGTQVINGKTYYFNPVTGILES